VAVANVETGSFTVRKSIYTTVSDNLKGCHAVPIRMLEEVQSNEHPHAL